MLAERGRLMLVGTMGGSSVQADLGLLMRKRITIVGTVLRSRPLEEKIAATHLLSRHIAPLVGRGALRPVVDMTMPLERAGEAHARVASNVGMGKVVLTV